MIETCISCLGHSVVPATSLTGLSYPQPTRSTLFQNLSLNESYCTILKLSRQGELSPINFCVDNESKSCKSRLRTALVGFPLRLEVYAWVSSPHRSVNIIVSDHRRVVTIVSTFFSLRSTSIHNVHMAIRSRFLMCRRT